MLTEDYLIDSLMCLVIAKLCKFPKEADMHEGEVREREREREKPSDLIRDSVASGNCLLSSAKSSS